jgi:serine/threonine-protein kinase
MAEVHLARDEVLGRDVALKTLRERLAEDEVFLKRFRREARSAATLNHPNVVQVYDQSRSPDGAYYIAMEHVPGGTLKERIAREGPLDPREAARVGAQVAEALRAAHEAGVVHRDVKSQNVLLTAAGDAKVADFGIARAADATTLSGPGAVLGTARYMSPEQATGSVATPRSDLYSLGVVLHEMLTGRPPFEADDPAQARAKHVREPPPRTRETNPAVPEAMDDLVGRLMAKDPEQRPGSASEVAHELRLVSAGKPAVAAPTAIPPPRPTRAVDTWTRRGRPLRVLAALAALAALLAVVGWGLGARILGGGVAEAAGDLADGTRGAIEGVRRTLLGPTGVAVPDVEGLTRAEARERLSEAGLGMEVRPRESSEENAGRVLEQSVGGAREVEEGSRILLAIGEGPRSAGAPDEVGAKEEGVPDLVGLSYSEAEEALEGAGFVLGGVEEAPSETAPAGVIVGQDPEAGSAAPPGAPVFLTTSTGRPSSASASAPGPASASTSAPASAAPP